MYAILKLKNESGSGSVRKFEPGILVRPRRVLIHSKKSESRRSRRLSLHGEMARSRVTQYALLPFLVVTLSVINAVLTLASLLPWFKKARHRFFLRVTDVQESNALGKDWVEVGDVRYFWPRMKELWYR